MKQLPDFIKINEYMTAYNPSTLAKWIEEGFFKQVGTIRTQYLFDGDNKGRSIEQVLEYTKGDTLYAVEIHRGVAIMAEIRDEEMLDTMREDMANNSGEDRMFVYDQEIDQRTVDLKDKEQTVEETDA